MSKINKIIRDYFNRPYSENIRNLFVAWLKSNRDNEEKEDALWNIWNEMKTEADSSTKQSFDKLLGRIQPQRNRTRLPRLSVFLRAASIVALPFFSAIFTWAYMKNELPANSLLDEKEQVAAAVQPDGEDDVEEFNAAAVQSFRFVVSPAVANSDNDTWYYINFTDALDFAVMDVPSADAQWGRTAFPLPDREEQLWKVVWVETTGDTDYYTLVNKRYGQLRYNTIVSDGITDVAFYYTLPTYQVALFSITELPSAGYGGGYRLLRKGRDSSVDAYLARTDNAPVDAALSDNSAKFNTVDFVLPENMMYPVSIFSTAEEPKWYYIQFADNGKVLQDNGTETRLTAEIPDNGNDAQLWRIACDSARTGATQLTNGSYSIVNKHTGNKICYRSTPTGGIAPPDGAGFYATDRDTVIYGGDERLCDVTVSGTLLEKGAATLTGFLIHGNYNVSSIDTQRTYFLTADASSNQTGRNSVVNSSVLHFVPASASSISPVASDEDILSVTAYSLSGKIVRNVRSCTSAEAITGNLAAGTYILKIKRPSGTETLKIIKR